MTETALTVAAPPGRVVALWGRRWWRIVGFGVAALVLGAIGGLLWATTTPLPAYVVRDDLSASMSELSLAAIVRADVRFALITGIAGLLIGVAGWVFLHRFGWVVTVVPILAALAAAIVTWRLGIVLGPTGFVERLAAASAGDVVQIDLQLRALSALLVGPFAAVTPIMLLSAFWPEPRIEPLDSEPNPTH